MPQFGMWGGLDMLWHLDLCGPHRVWGSIPLFSSIGDIEVLGKGVAQWRAQFSWFKLNRLRTKKRKPWQIAWPLEFMAVWSSRCEAPHGVRNSVVHISPARGRVLPVSLVSAVSSRYILGSAELATGNAMNKLTIRASS